MNPPKLQLSLLIVGLGLPMSGDSQIYTLSAPIGGSVSMGATDLLGPPGSASGGTNLPFGMLNETIYVDLTAQTVRQVGQFSISPGNATFVIHETNQIPQPFPNPPLLVPGNVTVSLSFSGTTVSFDTGPRSVSYNSSTGNFIFDGVINPPPTSYTGSYSLFTGGQTLTGPFSYSLSLKDPDYPVCMFTSLSGTGYPASVQLAGFASAGLYPGNALYTSTPNVVADVTATNAFHLQLKPGAQNWWGNIVENWSWSLGPVTAALAVTNPPTITSQPQSQTVYALTNAQFNATVVGTPPLFYQWSLNGTNISGATSSTLTVSNVSPSDLGFYSVVVTNGFGLVTSSNALLSMYPFIATPFSGAVTYWGKDATFSVSAWGTGPLSYQWFQNGVALQNATNQSLTLTSIQFTNAGLYSVVVSSSLGSVANTPEQVIVNPAGVSLGLYPGVTISGVVGYNYIIQRTADLSDTNSWVTMANLILGQPVQLWVDTNIDASLPAHPHHFYRVLPGQ